MLQCNIYFLRSVLTVVLTHSPKMGNFITFNNHTGRCFQLVSLEHPKQHFDFVKVGRERRLLASGRYHMIDEAGNITLINTNGVCIEADILLEYDVSFENGVVTIQDFTAVEVVD